MNFLCLKMLSALHRAHARSGRLSDTSMFLSQRAQPIWRAHSTAVGQVARETRHGVGWGRSAHCDWLPSVGYFSRLRETKGMSKAQKQTTEAETTKHWKTRPTFSQFFLTGSMMPGSIDFAKEQPFSMHQVLF